MDLGTLGRIIKIFRRNNGFGVHSFLTRRYCQGYGGDPGSGFL